jgi:hypothetical protein
MKGNIVLKYLPIISILLNFSFSAYYSPGMTMINSHQNQSHSICYGESDEGNPSSVRFGDYNGATNGGNYHVIFLDMAATW